MLNVTVTGAGAHALLAFYDYELNESSNTFSNEPVSISGAPPVGLAWEVDEPGFSFGDISDNIAAPVLPLDSTNALPAGSPDDVLVAYKGSMIVGAGETATVRFTTSESMSGADSCITHFDSAGADGTSSRLYYSTSSIDIESLPEPTSAMLLLAGLGLVGAFLRRTHQLCTTSSAHQR